MSSKPSANYAGVVLRQHSPTHDLARNVGRVEPVLESALQTPDGAWRVEVVRRGRTRWFRVVNGNNELDWLAIAAAPRILGEAGVDIADLVS